MKKSSAHSILSRILFVIYLIIIAFLCFATFDSSSLVKNTLWGIPTDKIVHFLMFAPFPILFYLSFDHNSRKKLHSVLFVLLTVILGCGIAWGSEEVQDMIPTRAKDIQDFYADAIAIAFTSIIVLIVDLSRKK